MKDKFIEVAPVVPLPGSSRQTYTYRTSTPLSFLQVVTIPFGNQKVRGVVIKTDQAKPPYPTKAIEKETGIHLTPQQYEFGQWLAYTMQGGLGFTLRLFFPPTLKQLSESSNSAPSEAQPTATIMVEKNDKKRTQSLIQVTKKSITQGKQVLILVPEVSCITRLKDSFPTTLPLFSYAASQTTAQKSAVWQAVASGQPAVVIGTQKALFLPWQTLGVVILEQAHYSTHKLWDQYPRLDNRYGASVLSRIHHADYVISASTLSLEMYFALEKSSVDFTSLNPLYPITQWLSPTFADKKANRLMPMIAARKIQSAARKKQNIFILHNNRQSSLAKELRLKSSSFVTIGTSAALTQLEGQKFEAVFWLFPEAAVFYPDIRSTERSWLLLCRLAQLSRGGKVTVITKHPRLREYFFAREGSTFFQQQLAERQRFHYPPFTDIVRLTFIDKKQSTAVTARKTLQERLKPPTKIRGPYQSLTNPTHTHLLLTGNLPTLAAAYQDLKADIVDVAPDKII